MHRGWLKGRVQSLLHPASIAAPAWLQQAMSFPPACVCVCRAGPGRERPGAQQIGCQGRLLADPQPSPSSAQHCGCEKQTARCWGALRACDGEARIPCFPATWQLAACRGAAVLSMAAFVWVMDGLSLGRCRRAGVGRVQTSARSIPCCQRHAATMLPPRCTPDPRGVPGLCRQQPHAAAATRSRALTDLQALGEGDERAGGVHDGRGHGHNASLDEVAAAVCPRHLFEVQLHGSASGRRRNVLLLLLCGGFLLLLTSE